MDRCDRFSLMLSDHMDGQLTEKEERELAEHLAICPTCRELESQLTKIQAAFLDLEEIPAPEGFVQEVLDQIQLLTQNKKKVIPFFRRLRVQALAGFAACAVLCIGIYRMGLWGPEDGNAMVASEQATASSASLNQVERGVDVPSALTLIPPDEAGENDNEDGNKEVPSPEQENSDMYVSKEPEEQESRQSQPHLFSASPETSGGTQDINAASEPYSDSNVEGAETWYRVGDQRVNAILNLERLPDGGNEVLGEEIEWFSDGKGRPFCVVTGKQMGILMALAEEQGQDLTDAVTDLIREEDLCAVVLIQAP